MGAAICFYGADTYGVTALISHYVIRCRGCESDSGLIKQHLATCFIGARLLLSPASWPRLLHGKEDVWETRGRIAKSEARSGDSPIAAELGGCRSIDTEMESTLFLPQCPNCGFWPMAASEVEYGLHTHVKFVCSKCEAVSNKSIRLANSEND